jgi:hypothetical protein
MIIFHFVFIRVLVFVAATFFNCQLYCGYWWNNGWVPGLVSQETRFAPLPQVVQGGAVFYGPGVMEATAEYYGLSLTDGVVDGVSLLTCAEIGQKVWLKRPGHAWEGPFMVSDCAQRDDLYAFVVYREEVVEVGFKTAVKWGLATPLSGKPWYKVHRWRVDDVQVSRVPPWGIDTAPVDMQDWFESVLTFARPKDDQCKLVYRAPNSESNPRNNYPLWRVNCEWVTFRPPPYVNVEYGVKRK